MKSSDAIAQEMRAAARAAMQNAYCRYSKFRMGAAILTAEGEIFAGCNVENASYGLTMCAERNAIFQAVAKGRQKITAVVVVTPTKTLTPPCGACRQVKRVRSERGSVSFRQRQSGNEIQVVETASARIWAAEPGRKMKAAALILSLALLTGETLGQTRGADFQLTKITKNLITAPEFTYTGAQQYQTDQRNRWLEMEVEFTAAPAFTDELTFKYFILLNGKLLTGEVTHTNVAAGRDLRSVMYLSSRTLARFMGNRAVTANSVENIAVQIVQQGAIKSELSLARAQPQWYAALPRVSGFVLNKNETPFAPLYWDRYEQIKTPAR